MTDRKQTDRIDNQIIPSLIPSLSPPLLSLSPQRHTHTHTHTRAQTHKMKVEMKSISEEVIGNFGDDFGSSPPHPLLFYIFFSLKNWARARLNRV